MTTSPPYSEGQRAKNVAYRAIVARTVDMSPIMAAAGKALHCLHDRARAGDKVQSHHTVVTTATIREAIGHSTNMLRNQIMCVPSVKIWANMAGGPHAFQIYAILTGKTADVLTLNAIEVLKWQLMTR